MIAANAIFKFFLIRHSTGQRILCWNFFFHEFCQLRFDPKVGNAEELKLTTVLGLGESIVNHILTICVLMQIFETLKASGLGKVFSWGSSFGSVVE